MLHTPDMQLHPGEKHYREYMKNNFGNILRQFLDLPPANLRLPPKDLLGKRLEKIHH